MFVEYHKLWSKLLASICLHQIKYFNGICGYVVLLQIWVRILVVVPFRVHYVISLPYKHVLIVIGSYSIIVRNQNIGYHQSATKC